MTEDVQESEANPNPNPSPDPGGRFENDAGARIYLTFYASRFTPARSRTQPRFPLIVDC